MNSSLVSIAVPAYKARFLKEAIDSALNQTYNNIEVIVVNDKSPDTEKINSIVNSYSDKRIRYYINEVNLGSEDPANNWEKCLSYAKGDFFSLLCDDDIYKPQFVEEMILLEKKISNCNVFRARGCTIDKVGEIVDYYPSSPQWESSEDYMYHVFLGVRRQTISEFFYRTNHLKSQGFVHLPLAWHADYFSVFYLSKCGGIASTNEPLVFFRMSGENISSKPSETGLAKARANYEAYLKAQEMIKSSDMVFKSLLEPLLEKWKYREDRYVITRQGMWNCFHLFFIRNKYQIRMRPFLMRLLLCFFK